ncbi:conserved hypothetical protein [uncultured Desulfobacterium sp.]|uniref:Uncharacterized protein n=1 Tax=uncultured Desulfobacterium sp. TaxID=201089 RepID=A0A445MZT4_9BACT|nr:conserved hypothetical protein [uncultured Desulfobacterium sp.]
MMESKLSIDLILAKRAVWDMALEPEDFLKIVRGELSVDWPSRPFCVARLLESASWYDVVRILSPQEICSMWPEAKHFVRSKSIKLGMEYACRVLH